MSYNMPLTFGNRVLRYAVEDKLQPNGGSVYRMIVCATIHAAHSE